MLPHAVTAEVLQITLMAGQKVGNIMKFLITMIAYLSQCCCFCALLSLVVQFLQHFPQLLSLLLQARQSISGTESTAPNGRVSLCAVPQAENRAE